jgi:hypothetical protein
MTYSIFDSGNLVVSSDREGEVVDAFKRLAAEAPASELDRYQLVAFDDTGKVVFDCAPGERIPQTA